MLYGKEFQKKLSEDREFALKSVPVSVINNILDAHQFDFGRHMVEGYRGNECKKADEISKEYPREIISKCIEEKLKNL